MPETYELSLLSTRNPPPQCSTLSSNYLIGGHVSSVSQLHAVIARNKIVHDSPQKSLSQKHIDLFVDSLFHNIICSVATYLVQISSFCTNKYKMAVLTLAQVFFYQSFMCFVFILPSASKNQWKIFVI